MDDDIRLDQLAVFRAAAAEGSFSAAARHLGRTQSAVSYAIANLEEALAVELFDRSHRSPVLTAAGRQLLGDAGAVIVQVDALRARARSMASGVEPTVSLAVDVMFETPLLLDVLHAFRDAFPEVTLHLRSETLGGVAELVSRGRCDLGISGPIDEFPDGLAISQLTTIEMVLCVSPSHPLASSCEVVPRAELQRHTQIVLTDRSSLTAGVDHGVYSSRSWRVADLRTKLELIEAGFGYGSLPRHQVDQHLRSGRLVTFRGAPWSGRSEFTLPQVTLHRSDSPPGPAGRWLLDEISKRCASRPAADPRPARAGAG